MPPPDRPDVPSPGPVDRFEALSRAIERAPDVDALDELWSLARREFAGRVLEALEQMIDARALEITDPALDPDPDAPGDPDAAGPQPEGHE